MPRFKFAVCHKNCKSLERCQVCLKKLLSWSFYLSKTDVQWSTNYINFMTIKLTTNIFFLKHLTSKISKVFQIYCKEHCTSQGQGRKAAQQTSSCKIAPPFWGEAALLSGIFEGSNLKISPILSNTAVLKAKREDPESSTESSPPCTSTSLSCPQVPV